MLGGGAYVTRHAGPRRPLDVGHVLEIVLPPPQPGGPPEIVDGECVDAVLREPERELLEERMEAADVGQDDDAGSAWRRGAGPECPELVAIRCRERQLVRIERGARNRNDRRSGVEVEAHAAGTSTRRLLRVRAGRRASDSGSRERPQRRGPAARESDAPSSSWPAQVPAASGGPHPRQ